jgi:hypothetical protein
MPAVKGRSAVVAGLFNALNPGLGFLYLGKALLAIAVVFALPLVLAIGAWTKLVFSPAGFLVVMLLTVTTWLASVIAAVVVAVAKRHRHCAASRGGMFT